MLPAFRHVWPVKPCWNVLQWPVRGMNDTLTFLTGRDEVWTGEVIMMQMCMPRGGCFESVREA